MNHRSLTPQQLEALHDVLFRDVNHLLQIKKRMEALGFPEADPLYVRAKIAYESAWELRRFVHHLTTQNHSR